MSSRCDLIVLVADLDFDVTVSALLRRPLALGIRAVLFDVQRHPRRDPGCFREAQDYLRPFLKQFHNALVVFDREGCGAERKMPREELEADLEERLARNGWAGHSAVVIVDPELEAWVWSDSPVVADVLGWNTRQRELQEWLARNEKVDRLSGKPADPKRAMERAIRTVRRRAPASLFRRLAERVSLARCTDPAFAKFRDTLQRWFPPGEQA